MCVCVCVWAVIMLVYVSINSVLCKYTQSKQILTVSYKLYMHVGKVFYTKY